MGLIKNFQLDELHCNNRHGTSTEMEKLSLCAFAAFCSSCATTKKNNKPIWTRIDDTFDFRTFESIKMLKRKHEHEK